MKEEGETNLEGEDSGETKDKDNIIMIKANLGENSIIDKWSLNDSVKQLRRKLKCKKNTEDDKIKCNRLKLYIQFEFLTSNHINF